MNLDILHALDLTEKMKELMASIAMKAASIASPLRETEHGVELVNPDERMSYGITKHDGVFKLSLLVENKNSRALHQAKEFEAEAPDGVSVMVAGHAYSAEPKEDESMKCERQEELIPGLSLSHERGFAGTLGGFVKVNDEKDPWPGVISAAHVLFDGREGVIGDSVLHPGYPDGQRVKTNEVGTLADFVLLQHHRNKSRKRDALNTEDIALVKPEDPARLRNGNLVPDPRDSNNKMWLKACVPAMQLFEFIGEPVYKVGRTTGFTEGVLKVVGIADYPIKLPDGKIYIFKDIVAIEKKGRQAFSASGDSGSIVYTTDGRAIGLVIGGSADYTLLSPLSKCLEAINAELLI